MRKIRTLVPLAATALAAMLVASTGVEPAMARNGGGHGFSAGHSFSGGKSFSGGHVRSFSGGRSWSGGTRHFSRTFRSPSVRSHSYAYRSHGVHHGHHHHGHGRGGVFVYGYPYYDGYYGYSDSCYWLRRRALATGSSYWWNRYYDCVNDY